MSQNFQWISASLFCSRNNWPLLISRGILPFLEQNNENIHSFRIQLNYLGGENLRLAILTTDDAAETLSVRMTQFFENVFAGIPLKKTRIEQVSENSYMSFPENSLYFGLYEIPVTENVDDHLLARELSTLMLDTFSESADEEDILTLPIYLHTLMLRVFAERSGVDIKKLVDFYQPDIYTSSTGVSVTLVDSALNENKEFLEEITREVLAEGPLEDNEDLEWILRWKNSLADEITKKLAVADYKIVYYEAALLVNNLAGLSRNVKSVLNAFISKSVTAFANNAPITIGVSEVEEKEQDRLAHIQKILSVKNFLQKTDVPEVPGEIRLFAIARNESLRLPYFLDYYKRLGVDRFFLVDNNSTDDTVQIAKTQKNVHVFRIEDTYKNHWDWVEYFLETYGRGHWCMVVDIDELFHYPGRENISLQKLTGYLEENDFSAVRCLLLDLYSDKTIADTIYRQHQDPLECCQYFDSSFWTGTYEFFDKKQWSFFRFLASMGGVRSRVFTKRNQNHFCLTKVPLFKYNPDTYLVQGMHAINHANIADMEGVVYHTKFMHDFVNKAHEESQRQEHFNNGEEYKRYHYFLNRNRELSLWYPGSLHLDNSEQLIMLGIMKASGNYRRFMAMHNVGSDLVLQ